MWYRMVSGSLRIQWRCLVLQEVDQKHDLTPVRWLSFRFSQAHLLFYTNISPYHMVSCAPLFVYTPLDVFLVISWDRRMVGYHLS